MPKQPIITVRVEGVAQNNQRIGSRGEKARKQLAEAMSQVSLFLEGEVKQSISGRRAEPRSVDTGRFRNSVKGTNTPTKAKVATNVKYAPILEYGGEKRRPRRHFNNTVDRNKSKVVKFIRDKLGAAR